MENTCSVLSNRWSAASLPPVGNSNCSSQFETGNGKFRKLSIFRRKQSKTFAFPKLQWPYWKHSSCPHLPAYYSGATVLGPQRASRHAGLPGPQPSGPWAQQGAAQPHTAWPHRARARYRQGSGWLLALPRPHWLTWGTACFLLLPPTQCFCYFSAISGGFASVAFCWVYCWWIA